MLQCVHYTVHDCQNGVSRELDNENTPSAEMTGLHNQLIVCGQFYSNQRSEESIAPSTVDVHDGW